MAGQTTLPWNFYRISFAKYISAEKYHLISSKSFERLVRNFETGNLRASLKFWPRSSFSSLSRRMLSRHCSIFRAIFGKRRNFFQDKIYNREMNQIQFILNFYYTHQRMISTIHRNKSIFILIFISIIFVAYIDLKWLYLYPNLVFVSIRYENFLISLYVLIKES